MLFKNSIRAEAAFVSSQLFDRKISGTADSGAAVQRGSRTETVLVLNHKMSRGRACLQQTQSQPTLIHSRKYFGRTTHVLLGDIVLSS